MGLRAASLFMLWLALSNTSEIRKGRTRNHGHYVCSTWGNNHFKTFDGDIYQFPGMCEYNFVSDCQDSYREFSVHIQRALNSNNHPEIQYILITVTDFTVYLKPKLAVVDGRIVKTPYYSSGLLIESNDIYTKVYAKLGLILIWNQEDALMVELDSKFGNQTCGLCGDYNGVPIYNEFISGVASYNSITYGNLQKISKPNDECEDPDETRALPSCNEHREECEKLLTSSAFADCHSRLNLEMYIQACMQDKCACKGNEDSFCLCSTISEYSRQCSHAGGRPGEWRTENFCYKTCPGNMVYRESSSPCMDTCSHLEVSSLCEEHYMDGCFCPEGTVYDDITENGCIPVSQCSCRLHGKGYSPGETITNECEECTCDSGRWTCKDLPCPGTCSVEGGSHIKTFDGKKYTFHGDCYYVLAKSAVNDTHALLAELAPCGSSDGQTCLKTVVLLVDDKKNVVVFRSDGSVSLNEMTVNVPHVSASFSVFKPSSYYLIVHTSFGLQLQIQLSPVMQLFVTADQSVQDIQGLCGNFNGMEGDDFKTTNGLVEATGSAFANTWKAQPTCADQAEKLEDPCTLSIESANYAEHWCSLLKNSEGPFARCHSVIDPAEYYKRCKYDTCLCKDNEECLCAALSSYSRACAFKGIILGGWRQSVCSDEVSACPGNQVFLYNLTMCQQTCRSIADGEKYCLQDFAPVDGCGCPDNTYLDNQDTCVPISKCPCYYKGSYLEPGEYVTKDGERCVCRNAKIRCTSVTMRMKSITECPSNKTYFDCNASPDWTSRTPVQLRCGTSQTDLYQGECVSGCVCPEGLFDDGRGGCVEEEDCPCIHNSDWYNHGQSITVDCNTCTCQKGIWSCTKNVCYGTCMIYGSGHYITFDGKFYDFDGSCEYVATQDYCGDKNSGGSFSIITENVPCGTTGVTCSKAIKMFIGKTELKLENKDYKEIQRDVGDDVHYQNKTVGLYLVIEASNGVMLIWDKKTTVFIKLTPDYKGKVCGLCGNFDDKANNDFTSRNGLQETNALTFGNSWKQSSVCPDVTEEIKPCDLKPHRKSWAEKECSLILSEIFKICHSKVNPSPFYDACVHDACSCDSGGDCDCFCSAVAAYAQECTKAQACVFWRSPDICPIFCDYYNPRNECEWHYEPCGSNVMTCRMLYNVSTNFSVPYLEGCYPRCPHEKPVYNEETKECVAADECWCYHNGKPVIIGGEIPTEENCTKCICRPSGSIECTPIPGCPCVINGTSYEVGQTVATIKDGDICTTYVCAENGSVVPGSTYPCPLTTSPSTITTSPGTSTLTTIVTTSRPVPTTPCLVLICDWSEWFDVSNPEEDGGDYETYDAIRIEHGNKICAAPENIECRAKDSPDKTLEELGQKVECNVTYGLICKNEEQDASIWHLCYNYEIRVNCCERHEIPCDAGPSSTPTASSVTTGTTVPTTTTQQSTTITTIPTPTATTTSQSPPSVTSGSTVSTTAPTPTPSESPTSTTTTTPFSSSSQGATPTVPGVSSSIPTVTSTVLPPIVTQTHSPPPSQPVGNCECTWTDWIDSSQPDRSDVNSGDYETIDKINNSSFVCVKAENISCRAKDYPNISLEELGQKVECSVNTGLICNNKDQENNGQVSYCHNYEIKVCCTPNEPGCIPSTELITTISTPVSHSTTTTIVFTSTVSSTAATTTPTGSAPTTTSGTTPSSSTIGSTVSTTPVTSPPSSSPTSVSTSTPGPTPTTSVTRPPTPTEGPTPESTTRTTVSSSSAPPTPTGSSPTTTSGTTPSSSTIGSTVSTTPVTSPPSPSPTSVSTSTPGPTPTTSVTPPPTTTGVVCTFPPEDCIWTDWIDVSYPQFGPEGGDDETFETIQNKIPSWNCTKVENVSCRAEKFPDIPIEDLGQKVECDVNTGLICKNKDQTTGGVIPMPVCLNYQIKVCCAPPLSPECTTAVTTTTTGETSTTVSLSPTTSTRYTPSVSSTTSPPTPTGSAPTTTSGTTPSSSTIGSTVSTTPVTSPPSPSPTSVSTSTPGPTPTTSVTRPPTSTEGPTPESTASTTVSSSSAPPTPTGSSPTTTSGTTPSSSTIGSTVSTTPVTSPPSPSPTSVSTSTPGPTPTTSVTRPPTSTEGPTPESTTRTTVSSSSAPPTPTGSSPTTTSGTTPSSSTIGSTVSTTPVTSPPSPSPTSVSTSTPGPTPTTSVTRPPTSTEGPTSQSTTSTTVSSPSVSSSSAPPTPTGSSPTTTSGTTPSSSTIGSTVSTTPVTSPPSPSPTSVSTSTPGPTPTTSVTRPPTSTEGPTSQSTTSTTVSSPSVSSSSAPPTPTGSSPTTTSGTTPSSSTIGSTVSTTPVTSPPSPSPTSVSTSTPGPTPTTSVTRPPTSTEGPTPESTTRTTVSSSSAPPTPTGSSPTTTSGTTPSSSTIGSTVSTTPVTSPPSPSPTSVSTSTPGPTPTTSVTRPPTSTEGPTPESTASTTVSSSSAPPTPTGSSPTTTSGTTPSSSTIGSTVSTTPVTSPPSPSPTSVSTSTPGPTPTTSVTRPPTSTEGPTPESTASTTVSSSSAPPTPTGSSPTTTSGTTPSSSTIGSTVSTTPVTSPPSPSPTSVSTSTPGPTPTTSVTRPPTSTEGPTPESTASTTVSSSSAPPTPTGSSPTTTSGTTPSSSTIGSTVSTTPVTSPPSPSPTSVSTSTPGPTPTTSVTRPPTSTEGPTPESTTRTTVSSSSAPPTPTGSSPTTTSGTTPSSSTIGSTVSTTPVTSPPSPSPTSVSTSTPGPTPTTSVTRPPTSTEGPTSQSTTSTTVSSPSVSSSSAPPTPTGSSPTTTSGTTPSSSTIGSTVSTTPVTSPPSPSPTSVSTSTPGPTPTTSVTRPPTSTEGPTPESTTRTTVSSSSAPPTPTGSSPTTTSGTTPSSSTIGSTVSTTPVTSPPSPSPTSVSTSTPGPTPTTSVTPPPTTTGVVCTFPPEDCIWTDWIDVSYPQFGPEGGDDETFETIQNKIPSWNCTKVENVSCRAEKFPDIPIEDLGQKVECDVNTGLICKNKDQTTGGVIPMPVCLNYQIKVCCAPPLSPECTTAVTTTTTGETSTTVSLSPTTSTRYTPSVSSTTSPPTPTGSAPTTTSGTTPSSSTIGSTVSTTPVTSPPSPSPTSVSTSTPGPTPTTSVTRPPTSTEGPTPESTASTTVSSSSAPPTPTGSSPTTTSGTTPSSSTIGSTVSTTPVTSPPSPSPTSVSTSTPGPTPTTSVTRPPTSTEGPTPESTTRTTVSSSSAPPTPTGSSPTTTSGTTPSSSTIGSTVSTTPVTSPPSPSPTSVSTSTPGPTPTTSVTRPPTSTEGPTSQSTTSTTVSSPSVSSSSAPPTPTGSSPTTTSGTTPSSSTIGSTVSTTPVTSPPSPSPTSVSTSTPGPTPTTSVTRPPTSTEGPTPESTTRTTVSSSSAPPTPTGSSPTTTSGTTPSSSTIGSTVSTTPVTSPPSPSPTSVSTSTPRPTPTTSVTRPPTSTEGPTPESTTRTTVSSSSAPPTPTGSSPTTTSGTTPSSSTIGSTVSTTPVTSPPSPSPTSVSTSTPGPTPTTSVTRPPTSTEGPTPESTTRTTVSSSSAPPTPTGSSPTTTSGTTPSSSTIGSTVSTTPVTSPPSPSPTSVSTSTPGPTPTTSVTRPPTSTEGPTPESTTRTTVSSSSAPPTPTGSSPTTTSGTTPSSSTIGSTVSTTPVTSPPSPSPTSVSTSTPGPTPTTSVTRPPTSTEGPTSQSTTSTTVSSPSVSSSSAPPTPTGSSPTTTSGTTPSSSTIGSTVSTTPVTSPPSPSPTSVSTSTPGPTPTTSVTRPPTSTEGTSSYSTTILTGSFSTEGTTTVSESSSTASVSTPVNTQSTGASSPLLTPSGSMSPPSVSTVPSTVTTSGTTPTKPFTTTSGTTSSSFSTVTATTITTSEIVSSGSASTSGTTPASSTVTVSGSSTYSTLTTLSTLSSTASSSSNCTISPNETHAPGESWWLCNCTKAICVENNTVVIVPVICEPPPKPTCSNGLAPVQVIDDDLCCWHWECDCYCTGWGDPHYMTFDGLYYSYQGNCTYVLVEEIEKRVDNFGVYIDNYHCDARDIVSCPRALIVRHETQEVRIVTVKPNTLEVEVTVNKQPVALPYKKFGLSVYESGINRVVEIPELKMNVSFNGLSFSIRMPYSLFGNNTQGQCGICNNNTADDCRLPNGNIAENCETMADYWQVVDPSKPQCSPGLVPTKAPSTTTGQPCKESSLCELLWGSVFEKCREVVKPDKYYAACVFDSCTLPDLDLECSSLQIYAAICADQNVCVDWRSHTNGVCSYECPKHKEYRACGPIQETTCKSSPQNETSIKQIEGCFCPNGTMLFDSGVDVCVNTCGCVGLDMIPREFGEKFTADCQDCVCLEGGNGIVCEPHKCPEQNKKSCSGKGFYEVTVVNSEDPCCPTVTCKCNTSLCTTEPPKCTLGFEVFSYIPSDECCPVYKCVPKKVCVHQNAEFLPNSSVFVDKCHNCFCTNEVNISTQLNVISCERIPCNTYCEPGYELQHVQGECCGKCVQTKCVIHTSHSSNLILNPGEFINDPYNNCTIYSCTSIKNQLISSTSEITCPAFNEESCKPGTVTFLPNGCCKTCIPLDSPTPCSVRERKDFIVYKNCRSLERVVLTECEGTCGTFSLYSVEASSMEHSCSCCKEVETSMKEVELKCPSGHSITHKYVYVESCGCQDTQCIVPESSESQSTEENDESTQNHKRRAISLTSK
ncbi:mucin-2 isoform X12 [Gallus gallus]|uniref:mucin-2 isoform X12 n=1 Tax=Gallus gallus TaxID=9031 RepID=UPI001AE2CF91|nr:mucin-2 isoform X12 [Gallus gallus]